MKHTLDDDEPVWPPRRRRGRVSLRWAEHPIRMATMALAAIALGVGIVGTGSLAMLGLGAAAGVVLGEIIARSRLQLAIAIIGVLAIGSIAVWLAGVVPSSRFAAESLGPGTALGLSSALRHLLMATLVATALRLCARRVEGMVGLELFAVVAAWATAFSAHREGVIDRPLWLSDWAWEHGYAPAEVLLAIGGVASLVLGGLLVAHSTARRRIGALTILPIGALLALVFFEVGGTPKPEPANDLGLTGHADGTPTDAPTGDHGPSRSGDGKDGTQGRGRGQQREGKGGGGQQGDDAGAGNDDESDGKQGEGKQDGGEGKQGEGKQGDGKQGDGKQGDGKQSDGKQGDGKQGDGKQSGGQSQGDRGSKQSDKSQPPQRQPNVEDAGSGQGAAPMALVILGDDYEPPSQGYYFRQGVWTHFNGTRLVDANRTDLDRDMLRRFPVVATELGDPPPAEAHQEVHTKVVLMVEHVAPFGLEQAIRMTPVPNPNPARFVRAYEVDSLAPTYAIRALVGKHAGDPAWTDGVRATYLERPVDGRYDALAKQLVAELPAEVRDDPFARALAIKVWMDRELVYSTSERHAGADDPAAAFLFGNRIGYCVHFAHAAVYLWRSLGIPARVGTGYRVSADARSGSALLIRGSDAHAWPELYLEGVGWVILDIAPERTLDKAPPPPDDELAQKLAELVREDPDPQAEAQSRPEGGSRFGTRLSLHLLLLLLAALVVLYGIKLWRAACWRWARPARLPALAYRAALDRLAEVGVLRVHGETREAFARRLANTLPSLRTMTTLNVAARFGPPGGLDPSAISRATWQAALVALRRERVAAFPWWRRVLGVLHPAPFVSVR